MASFLQSNARDLIKSLHLEQHPEGGYFVQIDERSSCHVISPFPENASRSLATSIFYLLTHDSPNGVIHMNKSVTYHVLHEGRAEYTLIKPGNPAVVETKIMGVNAAAGELRQLIVGTGIWKMSKLLDDDIQAAKNEVDKARLGCLITEVVVPGFHWDDHRFLDGDSLRLLFTDSAEGDQLIKRFSPYVQHS